MVAIFLIAGNMRIATCSDLTLKARPLLTQFPMQEAARRELLVIILSSRRQNCQEMLSMNPTSSELPNFEKQSLCIQSSQAYA